MNYNLTIPIPLDPVNCLNMGRYIVLDNGWFVCVSRIAAGQHNIYVSKDNGTTWTVLCVWNISAGDTSDYSVVVDEPVHAGGNKVYLMMNGYSGNNNSSAGRLYTVTFDATAVTPTTNLQSMASSLTGIGLWNTLKEAIYKGGYYYTLLTDLTYNDTTPTRYYRLKVDTTGNVGLGTNLANFSGSANVRGSCTVYVLDSGEAWVFYSSSRTLYLRRRSSTGTYQTAQTIFNHPTGTSQATYLELEKIRVVKRESKYYIFMSWFRSGQATKDFGYITTEDGITFTSYVSLYTSTDTLNNPIHFDVALVSTTFGIALSIPKSGNMVLHLAKLKNDDTFQIYETAKQGIIKILNIRAHNKLITMFVKDSTAGYHLTFRLGVDGIKRFDGVNWVNIDQAYRLNSAWDYNNGKRHNGTTWKDII